MRGFTLIEIMVAVLILGVLIAIAVPSYQGYVERTRRTEARTVLLTTAQELERCYSTYGAYNDTDCGLIGAGGGLAADIESEGGWYVITTGGATINATTFDLDAVPQDGQTNDACGSFELDQSGARDVTGTESADNCW